MSNKIAFDALWDESPIDVTPEVNFIWSIANKLRGIFAVVCQDPFCAALARQHNDSNVLCLGGKIIGPAIAMEIVKTWMHTDPLTAEKYRRRVKKVQEIDAKHCVAVK